MNFWLARERRGQEASFLQRFDPRFWTVDFPRPAMASIITTGADSLRVDVELHHRSELVGLIWESEDRFDHPLLAYETDRDYAHTVLSFRWRSSGVATLDQVNGPTLTVEGRDPQGVPRTWYVRLWNYASGTPEDAAITLPFSELASGWALPGEPIHPSAIERMFISIVAPDYAGGNAEPLSRRLNGWVEMSELKADGARAMLELGDVLLPAHGERLATAYDDAYNQTPARLVRNTLGLGYRDEIVHYVGMSHFPRLAWAAGNALTVEPSGTLCDPCATWHRALFEHARRNDFSVIASISYELFDAYCPEDWKQRTLQGKEALTGWEPPSTLLSPANAEAMAWLKTCAEAFARMLQDQQLPVRMQIGEPWWWVTAAGEICLYDASARARWGVDPPAIADMRATLDRAQKDLLDHAGAVLAQSTAALGAHIRASVDPAAELLLLAFTPTILDPQMPEMYRANLPIGWAYPAFDRLQLEDYDWLTANDSAPRRSGYVFANERLGYPIERQDYLAGFVLRPEDSESLWPKISAGLDEARERGIARRFVWALPQITRDGFTLMPANSEAIMTPFDDISFPVALGRSTSVAPEFSTSVSTTTSGFETRNSQWQDARMHFDVGPGIRSEAELSQLLAFFRARRGSARGFRIRDPFDHSSNAMVGIPTASDQLLAIGDGRTTDFPLIKTYGAGPDAQRRPITRPDASSLVLSIDHSEIDRSRWHLLDQGVVRLDTAPARGVELRAGFLFDVPVRFSEDRIDIAGLNFAAGEVPSVPLIEIREREV